MCFPEVNMCLQWVSARKRLEECTLGWFENMHKITVYNIWAEKKTQHMFGGIAMMSIMMWQTKWLEVTQMTQGLGIGYGRDTKDAMGWQYGLFVHTILANHQEQTRHKQLVYAWQQTYFDGKYDNICPLETFYQRPWEGNWPLERSRWSAHYIFGCKWWLETRWCGNSFWRQGTTRSATGAKQPGKLHSDIIWQLHYHLQWYTLGCPFEWRRTWGQIKRATAGFGTRKWTSTYGLGSN